MFMQKYTYIYWIHTDAMNSRHTQWQRRRKTSLTIFTSHFIARVHKGCVGFYCERELEIEHNCNILTPMLWPSRCVFLVLLGCSTGGPGPTLLNDGFPYCILSASSLDPNSSGPQAPSAWCGFLYHIPLQLSATQLARRTQLNYIIVRRPLDLWNRMFNRHQAEITVMQFRGHSLPVHQSMSVPWEFFSSSHFISQFLPTRFPLITAIRMCHLLPVHHLGMTQPGIEPRSPGKHSNHKANVRFNKWFYYIILLLPNPNRFINPYC